VFSDNIANAGSRKKKRGDSRIGFPDINWDFADFYDGSFFCGSLFLVEESFNFFCEQPF
jgi:hypothetical protein